MDLLIIFLKYIPNEHKAAILLLLDLSAAVDRSITQSC